MNTLANRSTVNLTGDSVYDVLNTEVIVIWIKQQTCCQNCNHWTKSATKQSNEPTLHLQPPAVERGSTGVLSRKRHLRTDPLRQHTWSLWSTGSARRWIRDASLKTLECKSLNASCQWGFAFSLFLLKSAVDLLSLESFFSPPSFFPLGTLHPVQFQS